MSILHSLHAIALQLPTIDLPDPEPIMPPGFEGVTNILAIAKWVGLIAAILALIFGAMRLMWNSRRGEGSNDFGALGIVLVAVIIIGGATSLVGFIAGA